MPRAIASPLASRAQSARDAYVFDFATNRLEAWTHCEAGAVDLAKFVTPRLTQFPTFDRADGRSVKYPCMCTSRRLRVRTRC